MDFFSVDWEMYLGALVLAIPAFLANMMPVVAARWHWLLSFDKPVDGGRMFRGKRILGDHKTWRGFLVGTLSGGLVGTLFWGIWGGALVPDVFSVLWNVVFGFLMGSVAGFGALFGDAVKSFFKRQIGIASGRPWIPFDYIDYILGTVLFSGVFAWILMGDFFWKWEQVLFLCVFATVMNPLVNTVSYLLGIKKTFW